MNEKIFISYNHNDKVLIDTIARRLELEFGRNNIFYDAWSIQPGDSIIGKMNDGLTDFTTFFFFVSANSLTSNMVELEWQTGLNRAVNNKLKFVSVRIDDCSMPVILTNKLYVDLYGEGMDSAIEKMKSVAKLEDCYKPLEDIQNIKAILQVIDKTKLRITIEATAFTEHNPTFAIACANELKDFSVCFNISEGFTITGRDELKLDDGGKLNAHTVQLQRALKPGFPFVSELSTKDISQLKCFNIYILKNAGTRMYQGIPISIIE